MSKKLFFYLSMLLLPLTSLYANKCINISGAYHYNPANENCRNLQSTSSDLFIPAKHHYKNLILKIMQTSCNSWHFTYLNSKDNAYIASKVVRLNPSNNDKHPIYTESTITYGEHYFRDYDTEVKTVSTLRQNKSGGEGHLEISYLETQATPIWGLSYLGYRKRSHSVFKCSLTKLQ